MSAAPGKETLFESLHHDYHPMVKQLCLGYLKGDQHAAEDLAQEVFLNAWKALDRFRQEASYKTWIYRITVNTCLLFLRKRNPVQLVAEWNEASFAGHQTAQPDRQRYQPLYRAIGALPELDRLIIMMVLDELSYEEIGAITGIGAINLRVKIHRIKKKMSQLLKES